MGSAFVGVCACGQLRNAACRIQLEGKVSAWLGSPKKCTTFCLWLHKGYFVFCFVSPEEAADERELIQQHYTGLLLNNRIHRPQCCLQYRLLTYTCGTKVYKEKHTKTQTRTQTRVLKKIEPYMNTVSLSLLHNKLSKSGRTCNIRVQNTIHIIRCAEDEIHYIDNNIGTPDHHISRDDCIRYTYSLYVEE